MMRNRISKLLCLLCLLCSIPVLLAQQPQQPQPGPGKKLVQGLFGPIEVDASDPRPGIAFGPPLQQPAAPPQPTAAQPVTVPQQQPQPDQPISAQFHFNNADLHQVIDTIAGTILGLNYVVDPTVRGTVN